jgi:hypothetical protein
MRKRRPKPPLSSGILVDGRRLAHYEFNDGVANNVVYDFAYPGGVWNRLRVDADSKAGTLNVYMDDVFLFTHEITVAERTGLSGLNSGNDGTYFDDFKVRKVTHGKK